MSKMKWAALAVVLVLIVAGIAATVVCIDGRDDIENEKKAAETRAEMQSELSAVQHEIWAALDSASENLTAASIGLRSTGLNGSDAREVLDELLDSVPFAVDVVTIDIDGRIIAAEPSEYDEVEGTDISSQAQVRKMNETMMPVMSDVFVMAEGFTAIDIEVPVFTDDGVFNGSVSVALDLESMIRGIVNSNVNTERFQFTALQRDGLEVYDTDEAQIGRNLFTDEAYENYTAVLNFMHELVGQNRGYGTYEYYLTLDSKDLTEKEVYWSSVGLYGAEWRLLMIHAI